MNLDELISLLRAKGLAVYDDQRLCFNLNIVGHRNLKARPNHFDDILHVFWKFQDKWSEAFWPITTYPGVPYLLNPPVPQGTAILVPGQYKGAYTLGYFKGMYRALIQTRTVRVYRDDNRDEEFNLSEDSIQEGYFGIDIHKAGIWNKIVGPSSAGCQVFQHSADFDAFIGICEKAARNWGNSFTYTLVEY